VVDTVEPLAGRLRVRVAGSPTIVAEITAASGAELDITPGRHVWVSVKATEVATYPA
jgi:molybdate transport system ATP-binding protein